MASQKGSAAALRYITCCVVMAPLSPPPIAIHQNGLSMNHALLGLSPSILPGPKEGDLAHDMSHESKRMHIEKGARFLCVLMTVVIMYALSVGDSKCLMFAESYLRCMPFYHLIGQCSRQTGSRAVQTNLCFTVKVQSMCSQTLNRHTEGWLRKEWGKTHHAIIKGKTFIASEV